MSRVLGTGDPGQHEYYPGIYLERRKKTAKISLRLQPSIRPTFGFCTSRIVV